MPADRIVSSTTTARRRADIGSDTKEVKPSKYFIDAQECPTLPVHIIGVSDLKGAAGVQVERSDSDLWYPPPGPCRTSYRTRDGKIITAHQWAVYDFISKIPRGRVVTYKDVCSGIGGGSPRSVGGALHRNPFAPTVPCHRVIAANLFIGGYIGEWGTQAREGSKCSHKMRLLAEEGVTFTHEGFLMNSERVLWKVKLSLDIRNS